MNIDDLIRDTVRQQEDLAADPDRIRAALPVRAARRQRARTRATLATVAAVVAVAVTVPVIVMRDNGFGTTAATVTVLPVDAAIPLHYRPTWLPEGMSERGRSALLEPGAKATTGRSWRSTSVDEGPGGQINLTYYQKPYKGDIESNVDINGRPGNYNSDSDSATVTWQLENDMMLEVSAPEVGLSQEDLLRIARSVEPDPTRFRPPLRLGWLPEGIAETGAQVKGDSPTSWETDTLVRDPQRYLAVSLSTAVPEAHGETVTINGRTAHLSQGDPNASERDYFTINWVLTMDVGEGRYLTVRSGVGESGGTPLTRKDIIRIAENVQLDPNPDLGWLGR